MAESAEKKGLFGMIFICLFILGFVALVTYIITWSKACGVPIRLNNTRFINTEFHPLGMLVPKDKVIFYDRDGRVYEIAVPFERGLDTNDIAAGTNTFVLFQKGTNVFFGKLE